jgi:hypothetical protein
MKEKPRARSDKNSPLRSAFSSGHRSWHLAAHMASRAVILLPLGVLTLGIGMAIYHWTEGLPWPDAFLNAAMLLGGMGPVDAIHTTAGKWFAGFYALFAGVVFLVVAGVMLVPVIHHVLHRFHLESGDEGTERKV